MKNFLLALSMALAFSAVISLNACKKTTDNENDSQSAQDDATVTTAINITGDDAGAVAGQVTSFTGKTQGLYEVLCGVQSIDSSGSTITLTYGGNTPCFGLIRSGSVLITLGGAAHWQDPNATITITYNNFSVTDGAGNKYSLTGSHVITNVSGGLAWKVAYGLEPGDSAIHQINATMTITFPNNSTRAWNLGKMRKWVSTGSLVTVTDYPIATTGNPVVSGTNRFGNGFTTSITSNIISSNNCDYYPYAGVEQHVVGGRTTTITFGTNSSGVPATNGACGTGFYIQYFTTSGVSGNLYVPY